MIVAAGTAEANAPLTRVSTDPYTNPTSQHATELEPDTFAHHGTVLSAFQVGRFFDGGASDIGVVRSGTAVRPGTRPDSCTTRSTLATRPARTSA